MLFFKEESNIILEISELKTGVPIFIKNKALYLSCQKTANTVDFYIKKEQSGRNQWILEVDSSDDDIYYIKTNYLRDDGAQYLGNPNINYRVFLYTTKNRFTRWNIINVEDDKYLLKYVGDKFNEREHTIVVARYNENLDWLLPYNDCTIVYNKGLSDLTEFRTIHNIKNIGREGNTYLHHIINNYDKLQERVTFLQGESLNHNSTILYGLDNYEKLLFFQPLGLRWLESKHIPPTEIIVKYKTVTDFGLIYLVIKINSNLDYLNEYYFFDAGVIHTKNNYIDAYKLNDEPIIDNFLSRSKFPLKKPTKEINYTWSALFSVKKEKIRNNSKESYINICKELVRTDDQGGPDGYVLEKLWCYLLE